MVSFGYFWLSKGFLHDFVGVVMSSKLSSLIKPLMSDLDGMQRSVLSSNSRETSNFHSESKDRFSSLTMNHAMINTTKRSKTEIHPKSGFLHDSKRSSNVDSKLKPYLTDLHEKLPTIGDTLREQIKALKVKDLPPKSEVVDMMSAGKDRKNDISVTEDKAYEKILAEERSKDTGPVTCIDMADNREYLAAGTKKGTVMVYYYKQSQLRSVKLKTKAPVTCLEFNIQCEFIACGTEGGVVYLIRVREKELEQVAKADGFTRDTIRDVRFTESGLSLIVLDYSESIFYLYSNLQKNKPIFEPQPIKNISQGNLLSHCKIISPPRLDGTSSKIRLLFAGGFGGSILYRFSKGDFVQLDSLEAIPFADSKISRKGSVLVDENFQSFCLEDSDVLSWVSPTTIKLLYIVKGSRVCIRYVYLSANDELEITSFSEFNLPDTVMFASVICPGIMCIVDSFQQIKFVNMRRIIRSQREENKVDFATSNYITLKSSVLQNENVLWSDEPFGKSCRNYFPYISFGKKGRFVHILTSKKLIYFELLHWETVATRLKNEIDYLSVIQMMIEISEGDYYKLYGISPNKEKRREKMTEFILNFVEELREKKAMSGSPNPEAMMRFVAVLLVKTGNIEYLFNDFYEHMLEIGLGEDLKKEIEEYFRSGQLGKITPESLNGTIIEAFDEQIQKRLLLDCFDSTTKQGQLLSLAIRKKFHDLVFYMAPKHDAASSQFALAVTYELNMMGPEDSEKKETLFLRILWYCESLLRGCLMFNDPLDAERTKELQLTILNWLIDPSNAKTLWKQDYLYFLDLLLMGLDQKLLEAMEGVAEKEFDNGRTESHNFEVLSRSSFRKFDVLFKNLKVSFEGPQKIVFDLFLAIIMMAGLPRIKLERNSIESLMVSMVRNFDVILGEKRIKMVEEDIQTIVFDVFITNSSFLKDSKAFTQAAENSQSVFKVMMLETKDNFEETFNVYIKLIKDKMSHSALFFQWLKRVFTEKSDKRGALELTLPIKTNFQYLVDIGLKETMDVWGYFENSVKIDSTLALDRQPEIQLEFLRLLMKASEDKESKMRIPDKIKLLFFERLCQFSKDEVLLQLKKNNWPTLECLEICQQYQVELGVAYINERLGKYMDALEIYKNRFSRFVNEFRSKISGKNERFFYEEVYNEDVKDGNLFKIHALCSETAKLYLHKLEKEHQMFRALASASDTRLEVFSTYKDMLQVVFDADESKEYKSVERGHYQQVPDRHV